MTTKYSEIEHKKFNVVDKGNLILTDMFNTYPEFLELEKCKDEYTKERTPDELSRCATQMSVLLCRIGEIVAEMTSRANEAYTYRKFKFLWNFNVLSNKMTIKERENIALDETFETYETELINRYLADMIKIKYDNYSRLINVLQTRLSVLKQERINSNLQ